MDMLIRLSRLPTIETLPDQVIPRGIEVRRAMAYERRKVCQWVETTFGQGWADECAVAFGRQPIGCYLAIQSNRLCGFCCLETTHLNFIGPIGVSESLRAKGAGRLLLLNCLLEMRLKGYAYAIAGNVGSPRFFERVAAAVEITGDPKGAYPAPLD
jgi:hypothetical protein